MAKFWNPRTGRYEDTPPSIIGQGISAATADISAPAPSGGGFTQQLPAALQTAQGAAGGSGGGALSGALGGAAAGASIGSLVPGVGTLIGGGVGALVGGIGAGLKSKEEDEKAAEARSDAMNMFLRQQEEDEKQNKFNRMSTTRSQNMAGIGQLADMRTQALANSSGRMFQRDLIRAIQGR